MKYCNVIIMMSLLSMKMVYVSQPVSPKIKNFSTQPLVVDLKRNKKLSDLEDINGLGQDTMHKSKSFEGLDIVVSDSSDKKSQGRSSSVNNSSNDKLDKTLPSKNDELDDSGSFNSSYSEVRPYFPKKSNHFLD